MIFSALPYWSPVDSLPKGNGDVVVVVMASILLLCFAVRGLPREALGERDAAGAGGWRTHQRRKVNDCLLFGFFPKPTAALHLGSIRAR